MTEEDNYNPRLEIEKLAANFDQPAKFAALFCEAAGSQKSIDKALKKIFKTLIKEDTQVINTIKKYQKEVNDDDWRNFRKTIGRAIGIFIWSLIMIALTLSVQTATKKFIDPPVMSQQAELQNHKNKPA